MDFIKKGMISTKYVADGCEFKKQDNNFKLISTLNDKYQPFIGQTHSESVWDLVADSNITEGAKHREVHGLLLDHFKSGHTIFNNNANILLKKGEQVIFQSHNNVTLKEPKSIRVTNSVHAGTSHRHKKSSFGYGTSKSVGETKEVIKDIDIGQVIITNKRFIYSGQKRNIDVNISQITAITPYTDGFKLQRKTKQKPEYFVNVDAFAFNYNFNKDTYFYMMDGQFIKAMIEGGLNKTPKISRLQQLSSQKQIESKLETTKVNFDGFSIEYNGYWKKVANEKESHYLTLERIDGNYKAKIHLSASNVPQDFEKFESDVKNLISQNEFKLTKFEKINVNGINVLSVSSLNKNDLIELDVAYFHNEKHQFGLFLTNPKSNTIAKKDYENIVNSIHVKESNGATKVNFCPNCGMQIDHDGNFCQNCGFKLNV